MVSIALPLIADEFRCADLRNADRSLTQGEFRYIWVLLKKQVRLPKRLVGKLTLFLNEPTQCGPYDAFDSAMD
jgi:hypothetical protein